MAFQVWGCHLSAWLMSAPSGSISFRHPSLHHQRKSTALWGAGPEWHGCASGIKLQKWKEKKKRFWHAGRSRRVLRILRIKECIYCRKPRKQKGKTWHSHFVHNRSDTAKKTQKARQTVQIGCSYSWNVFRGLWKTRGPTLLSQSIKWFLLKPCKQETLSLWRKREKASGSAYVREKKKSEWI